MDIVFNVILILHIVGGSLGLLTGAVSIIRIKGDNKHKLVGKVFFVSMLIAGISSLILSFLHPNYFLFMVGVFTIYLVSTGQIYLNHKPKDKIELISIEWVITILMFLAGLLFVGIGISKIIKLDFFGNVFITFGVIGLVFVLQDFKNFNGKSKIKNYWLIGHLQRMTAGFIAALTAFLVVNNNYFPKIFPGFLYWLLPTIIFTPLIIKWSRKYKVKKN